jgi:hypothetical protein
VRRWWCIALTADVGTIQQISVFLLPLSVSVEGFSISLTMTNPRLKKGLTAITLFASGHTHCSALMSISGKSAVAPNFSKDHRRLSVSSWSPVSTRVFYTNNAADDMEDAAMPLSTDDVLLLQSLRRRQVKLPIMMLDTLLPHQVVTVRSSDPTFSQLLEFATSTSDGRVAVI